MRFVTVLAAAMLLLSAPSFAQADKKAPAPPTTCEALATSLGFIERTAETSIEDLPDGCNITNFFANFGQYARYRIGEAALSAPGLFDAYANQSLPAELDLALSGFLVSPDTGSALTTYIMEMLADPFDIHLGYRRDQAARALELTDFSVTAKGLGAFRFSGRFSDTDLDLAALLESPTILGTIDQLALEIDNARFFSTLFAPAALGTLPYDQDPRPLIESYKQVATSFIADLPSANVSDKSKAALTAFVAAFPKPSGDYTLDLRADPGLSFTSVPVDNLPAVIGLRARLQITASHTPADLVD